MNRLLILPLLALLSSCTELPQSPLPTVQHLDTQKYAGQWHEIARLPHFFERDLVAAKATYAVLPDGKISVLNEGVKANGEQTSILGSAYPANDKKSDSAKLKVRFNRFPASLFAGDYWILDLNIEHTRAIVGSPNRKLLWLLSKDPQATSADFVESIQRMNAHGFPMEQLIHNPQRMK